MTWHDSNVEVLCGTPATSATVASISDRIEDIHGHFNNYQRWFGFITASGTTHVASDTSLSSFQMDAGNDDYGAWVQILGDNDTPAETGKNWFSIDRIFIEDVETDVVATKIQIVTDTVAASDGISSDTYTEMVVQPETSKTNAFAQPVLMEAVPAHTKAWARCWVKGQNTSTVDFMFSILEHKN